MFSFRQNRFYIYISVQNFKNHLLSFKDPAEVWVRTPTMTRGRLRNSESHTPTTRPDGATALPPGDARVTASVTFEDNHSSPQAQAALTTPTSLGKVQTSVFRLERSESARRLAQAREEIRRRPPSPGPHDADYSWTDMNTDFEFA